MVYRCDTLCTSAAAVYDVAMFLHSAHMARHVHSYDKHNSRDSNQILFNVLDQQVLIATCVPGAKSAICDCLVSCVDSADPVVSIPAR